MKKKRKEQKPKVNPELAGLDLRINSFGEVEGNVDMDKIRNFLTENVPDKKLMERNDESLQKKFKKKKKAPSSSTDEKKKSN